MLATGVSVPVWASNSLDLLAGAAIPLMLVALGHSLASFRIQRAGTACLIAALRLALGFGIGVLVVQALALEGVLRGVVLIEASMPVAVFNFLMAARYDRDPEDVAGSILLSTVLAFITLPALVLFALGR